MSDIPSEPTGHSCDRDQRRNTTRIVRTLRLREKRVAKKNGLGCLN
jgi:hypothetical protein